MRQIVTTLAIIVRGDRILLAMKKRGLGEGLWNGPGGKVEESETIEEALVRECQEEIGITPTTFKQVATHTFTLRKENQIMQTHAYLVTAWDGEPIESSEMRPQWWQQTDIPYDEMWEDDRYWLPQVLAGHRVKTAFTFDTDGIMIYRNVRPVA